MTSDFSKRGFEPLTPYELQDIEPPPEVHQDLAGALPTLTLHELGDEHGGSTE